MSQVALFRPLGNGDFSFITDDNGCTIVFQTFCHAEHYLRKHGIDKADVQFLESCGVCKMCGNSLFPSLLTHSGYAYQCFECDEDYYGFEQAV